MAQAVLSAQSGLYLSQNPFNAPPQGGLAVADNCVIKNQGIIEPRRGYSQHSTLANAIEIGSFNGTLGAVTTDSSNNLKFWNGSSWQNLGTITPPGTNIPNQVINSPTVAFVTTGTGLQAVSPTGPTLFSTVIPTPNGPTSVTLSTTANNSGAMTIPAHGTYAYVLVIRDQRTGTPIRSIPSNAATYLNTTGSDQTNSALTLGISLAVALVTGQTLELYRSLPSTANLFPDGDYFFVSNVDISGTTATYVDSFSDGQLGPALYTNAGQQGAAEENDPAPISSDVCEYKNQVLYSGVIADRQVLTIVLRDVNTAEGQLLGDATTILFGIHNVQTPASNLVTAGYNVTAANQAATTAEAMNINFAGASMDLTARAVGAALIITSNQITSSQITATFQATTFTVTSGNVVRTTGTPNLVTVTQVAHPWVVGAQVNVATSADAHFPTGVVIVASVPTANTWTYHQNGTAATSSGSIAFVHFKPSNAWVDGTTGDVVATLPSQQVVSGTDDDVANMRVSKPGQPQICPLEDSFTVGTKGVAILKSVPLKQSVMIFKAAPDGIWRMTGSSPDPASGDTFVIQPEDQTTVLGAPQSPAAMNDAVYFLSTRGPMVIGESTGVAPLAPQGYDCPIKDILLERLSWANSHLIYGRTYPTDNLYLLATPSSSSDTQCQETWVYNTNQGAWTHWNYVTNDTFLDPVSNTLFYVDGVDVFQERKNFNNLDFGNGPYPATIDTVASSTNIKLTTNPASLGMSVGDTVTQGSSTSRILTIDNVFNHLTLDAPGSWSSGAITFMKSILYKVTYLPWAGGEEDPGAFHKFQEFAFNFRSLVAPSVTVTSSTDMDPSEDQFVVIGRPSQPANVNIRAGFSRNKGSGVMLSVGFEQFFASCPFQLQSTSLIYQPLSTRTPRNG